MASPKFFQTHVFASVVTQANQAQKDSFFSFAASHTSCVHHLVWGLRSRQAPECFQLKFQTGDNGTRPTLVSTQFRTVTHFLKKNSVTHSIIRHRTPLKHIAEQTRNAAMLLKNIDGVIMGVSTLCRHLKVLGLSRRAVL